MKSLIVALLLVALASAMNVPRDAVFDERVHFDVNLDGQMTEENIEMNYEENYVRVTTPSVGNIQSMVLVHDYTKGQTLVKLNGRCYMLNEYPDIPTNMEDWYNLRFNMEDGVVQAGGVESYRTHNYKIVPLALNRTVLPSVMQNECPGEIDVMVLQETVTGQVAYQEVESKQCLGAVYLPTVTGQIADLTSGGRAKRATPGFCGVCYFSIGCDRSSSPPEGFVEEMETMFDNLDKALDGMFDNLPNPSVNVSVNVNL